MYVMNILNL